MKVVITAGGTGGHIYPALAVLDKIKEDKNNEYLYIGTTDRMESEIVPSLDIPYESLKIKGLSKNLVKNIENVKDIIASSKKAKSILEEFKPNVVIGFGGYVTLPVIKEANKLGIKTAIHEQNFKPGKTNKFLSKKSDVVFISFEESKNHFKNCNVINSGNPCEERALLIDKINKTSLGFDRNKKLIIIVMGSLGSTVVNEKLCDFLRNFDSDNKEILFITGKDSFKELNNNLIVGEEVKMVPYFENLPGLMKDADLIISRAGASTISEILATSIPSILIPSPYVADNHQYYNALDLEKRGLSVLLEQENLNKENLNEKINLILDDKEFLNSMKSKLNSVEKKNSSTIIYQEIKKLVK